jgi:pyruvate-ferredoxin/flavodoxin oxidoreductase
MEMQAPLRDAEVQNWNFFEALPSVDRSRLAHTQVKDIQLLDPLFEFSGACSGCGETPYIKLLTQLFGDRLYIANATGCSSIYGGNLPTTPYTVNKSGRGPTWSNSLFEDNAEFGLGMRLALNQQKTYAEELLLRLTPMIGEVLVTAVLTARQSTETEIEAQRERVRLVRERLASADLKGGNGFAKKESLNGEGVQDFIDPSDVRSLLAIADSLVRKSVWMVGGDGWAYDIGFGGLDHVLGSGQNVKVLVLDTETYSNTGGQMSKATPRGAVAKFAAGGKTNAKKDLAMEAVAYGSVYVARVAMGGIQPLHCARLRPCLRHGAAEECCAFRILAVDAL